MIVVIKRKDGGVSLIDLTSNEEAIRGFKIEYGRDHQSDHELAEYEFMKSENMLTSLIEKGAVPKNRHLSWELVSSIPEDRTFRSAWNHDLAVDMEKAVIIQMDRIRRARDEKLLELDKLTLAGVDVQGEKQVLRDLPQTFDLSVARTPDELKSLWPKELKE